MKSTLLIALLALAVLPGAILPAQAQRSSFTLQGQLNDGASPATGNYEFRFSLFNAATAGAQLTLNPPVITATVNNGDFNLPVDITALADATHSIQDDSHSIQDNWLEISVRLAGGTDFTPLLPRQRVYALPAAIFSEEAGHTLLADHVGPASVSHTELLPGSVQLDSLSVGTAVTSLNGLTDALNLAAGTGITLQSASGTITISATGGGAGGAWLLGGNVGVTSSQFIGTTDNHPVEFRVNGQRALRLEPDPAGFQGNSMPNLIGGASVNSVAAGITGAVIAGGTYNIIGSMLSTIAGGQNGTVGTNSAWSFLGSGTDNTLGDNSHSSFIGGGDNNVIQNSLESLITGGVENTVTYHAAGTIGGGAGNHILNTPQGVNNQGSVIAGGSANFVEDSTYSVVSGGGSNHVQTNSAYSTIGGGSQNIITTTIGATIAGGLQNTVNLSGGGGAIGGGSLNVIGNGTANAGYATIPGGYGNLALGEFSFAAGAFAQATNLGTFVWSDGSASQFNPFSSQVNNEFAVRALGGVRLETGGAGLVVDGVRFNPAGSGFSLADGAITSAKLAAANRAPGDILTVGSDGTSMIWAPAPAGGSGSGWSPTGNAGTGTGQFLGTTDNQTLELKVNNLRALRLEPTSVFAGTVNVIAGSSGNYVPAGVSGATVAGGGSLNFQYDNTSPGSTNEVDADFATVGGGVGNLIQPYAWRSTISGGYNNTIQVSAIDSLIAGGRTNTIQTRVESGTIGGGKDNILLTGANFSTISGGEDNAIQAAYSAIPGGQYNFILTNSPGSFIASGGVNLIDTNSGYSSIGGGNANLIQPNSRYSVIAGGIRNTNAGFGGVLGGGIQNSISGSQSALGGGYQNSLAADDGTIGGGAFNFLTGGGGTIAGGYQNTNTATYGTIPGGVANSVSGNFGLAAGYGASARHQGAFVWADTSGPALPNGTPVPYPSTGFNQFLIRAAGGVGVGTNNPQGAVHIASANYSPQLRVEQTIPNDYARLRLGVSGSPAWDVAVASGSTPAMTFWNGSQNVMTINYNGNVTASGTFNGTSDRNAKQDFTPVDKRAILERVTRLPITTWQYKADSATRHIGPVAQDFYREFQVGTDERHIATVDEEGVALAAIQGLHEVVQQVVQEKDAAIRDLQTKNDTLEQRLRELEKLVHTLANKQ